MAVDNVSQAEGCDLASSSLARGAATMLSDSALKSSRSKRPDPATRIGNTYKVPPMPIASENYPWHLANRNKRGMAVDLKSQREGDT